MKANVKTLHDLGIDTVEIHPKESMKLTGKFSIMLFMTLLSLILVKQNLVSMNC